MLVWRQRRGRMFDKGGVGFSVCLGLASAPPTRVRRGGLVAELAVWCWSQEKRREGVCAPRLWERQKKVRMLRHPLPLLKSFVKLGRTKSVQQAG